LCKKIPSREIMGTGIDVFPDRDLTEMDLKLKGIY